MIRAIALSGDGHITKHYQSPTKCIQFISSATTVNKIPNTNKRNGLPEKLG
jgi:hypothetical protein